MIRLGQLQKRLRKAAVFGTLSIFVTKILLALAVEIPIDQYLTGAISPLAIGASIAAPPLLMAILVLSIRPSSQENIQRVVMEVMRIVFSKEKTEPRQIHGTQKRPSFLSAFVFGIYILSFALSFGALAWGLAKLQLSWPSIVIFLIFLSLVAFAGTRIRKNAKELLVTEEKQTFLDGIFDFFSLPLVHVGKWLSSQITRYNVLLLLLNFLIEIPFQLFVESLEQWRAFLKEKREKIR